MTTRRSEEADASATMESESDEALWIGAVTAFATAGLAFALYWYSAAPGLTWSHQGADGGDFLAAAVTNGVPHPSGYPLYMAVLRAWLWIGGLAAPGLTPARLGNLLSAVFAAVCVGVSVLLIADLMVQALRSRLRWPLAAATGLLWAVSPLMWGQALISEVYALHLVLASILAWLVMARPTWLMATAFVVGLGLANHLTFVLLLPAAGYHLWRSNRVALFGRKGLIALCVGVSTCVLVYLCIPIAVASGDSPAPVNWGYADNWDGFWWLVSGQAYQAYFLGHTSAEIGLRLVALARSLVTQFTPIGLLLAAVGLTFWDRSSPHLRTFSLLWMLPISGYAVLYATRDSQVYLLPALWMMTLWIGVGLAATAAWLQRRVVRSERQAAAWLTAFAMALVAMLLLVRMPAQSLRTDFAAEEWLLSVMGEIEPDSIVVSSSDAETFALWYGAWATGDLLEAAPGVVTVNDSLYQFDWYRRLMGDVYPDVDGVDEGFSELLSANESSRPIYFVEPLDSVPESRQQPTGSIWKYVP